MLTDVGFLILRLVVGAVFIGHGAQKLFGWFGGHGLSGTAQFMGSLGLRPAHFWAAVVAFAELVGGLLIALGFLGPVGPALVLAVMLVAILAVHWTKGFWNANGGLEFPLVLGTVAVALALAGHGAWSVDRQLGLTFQPAWQLIALAAAIVGAVIAIATPRVGFGRHRTASAV
jgi:putative oxidoreductase